MKTTDYQWGVCVGSFWTWAVGVALTLAMLWWHNSQPGPVCAVCDSTWCAGELAKASEASRVICDRTVRRCEGFLAEAHDETKSCLHVLKASATERTFESDRVEVPGAGRYWVDNMPRTPTP
ncbi:MAG: hypothetical protein WC876_01775 [Candidatus Thermoplasmatota archaeon]|jgi:hypothetical protein